MYFDDQLCLQENKPYRRRSKTRVARRISYLASQARPTSRRVSRAVPLFVGVTFLCPHAEGSTGCGRFPAWPVHLRGSRISPEVKSPQTKSQSLVQNFAEKVWRSFCVEFFHTKSLSFWYNSQGNHIKSGRRRQSFGPVVAT